MIGSQYVAQAGLELPVIFLCAPPVHILDSSRLLAFVATSATYIARGCNCITCLSESEPRGTWAGRRGKVRCQPHVEKRLEEGGGCSSPLAPGPPASR